MGRVRDDPMESTGLFPVPYTEYVLFEGPQAMPGSGSAAGGGDGSKSQPWTPADDSDGDDDEDHLEVPPAAPARGSRVVGTAAAGAAEEESVHGYQNWAPVGGGAHDASGVGRGILGARGIPQVDQDIIDNEPAYGPSLSRGARQPALRSYQNWTAGSVAAGSSAQGDG